jgi:NAD-dependent SIR2 family protein deacetylase
MKKWRMSVYIGKACIYDYFDSAEEAARARDLEVIKLHGEFARLNFPTDWEKGGAIACSGSA